MRISASCIPHFIAAVLLLVTAYNTTAQVNNHYINTFAYKRYCGMCANGTFHEAYREIVIDSSQMIRTIAQYKTPTVVYRDTITISSSEWEELIHSVNLKEFFALPEKINCPGCTDSPSESIEISYLRKKHNTWFERRDTPEEITALRSLLDKLYLAAKWPY